ncbi:MAG: zinc-ribbon domain-containing protein [Eubacteriales bacterium]
MGVFDQFVNKAKSSAQVAGQKANELMEITKLSMSQSEKNDEVNKLYAEMGCMVYEAYLNNDPSTEELHAKCALVDAKLAEIKEIREKINQLKKIKVCAKCGEENPSDNQYCAQCGEKLPDAPQENIVVEDYVVQEPEAEAADKTEEAGE